MKILGKLQIIIYFILSFSLGFGQSTDTLNSYSNKELFEKAKATYNKVYLKELSQRELLPEEKVKTYKFLGIVSVYEGKYAEAKDWFEKLLKISKNDHDKITAYIRICETKFMLGDSSQCFQYMDKALNLINHLPPGNQKFGQKFFTLSIYALSGDFKTYQKELNKLNYEIRQAKIIQKNNDEILKSEILQGQIYLELSDINTRREKIELGRKYIDSARVILKGQQKNNFDEVNIYLKYQDAYNLYYAKKYDASSKVFVELLKDCENYKMNEYGFMAKVYLGKNYYQLKDYQKSLYFSESALRNKLPIPDYSEDFEVEALRYAYLSTKELGDKEKEKKYEALFVEKTKNLKNYERDQFISSLVNKMNAQEEEQKNNNLRKILYAVLAISVLFSLLTILYSKYRNRKNIEIFRQKYMGGKQVEIEHNNAKKNKKEKVAEIDKKTISILEKLSEFEKGNRFLEQNFSLSTLASFVNTNTVTLSSIINTHKKNNFNDYINGLRIDYIIEKMKTNPKYLNYKISYLAEESGFSSHSIFTKAFKKRTHITPSQLISLISENADNQFFVK